MKAVLDEAAVQDVIRFLCEGIPPHGMVDASIQISPTAFDSSSSLIVFNIATFVNRNRAEELINKWKTEYDAGKGQ